jgi:MFS family permease
MAEVQEVQVRETEDQKHRDRALAATLVSTHGFQHMYGEGFLVIIPAMYQSMGLVPIQVSLISVVRQVVAGITTMGGGVLVDRMQHRRGVFLGLSLSLMGLGYMLVGVVPGYTLILIGLAFASTAGSLWHPIALGLLSQRFPERRGFMLSLHRAGGSVGSTLAPVLVGLLLTGVIELPGGRFVDLFAPVTWQQVLLGAFPIAFLLGCVIWIMFWRVGDPPVPSQGAEQRSLGMVLRSLGEVVRQRGLLALLLVAGVRGMGDRTLLLFLTLYLTEDLGMSFFLAGLHLSLLQGMSIIFGPSWGLLSDRWGRKPVILFIMIASAMITGLMIIFDQGFGLTTLIVLMGTLMYSVNSLVQAAAMDMAEGRHLEGSLIGLLWGNNAVFGSISPIIVGVLASIYGFHVIFPYATVLYLVGVLATVMLPATTERRRARA